MCPLSVALFELFTVCSAKMDEPIDGKASNRLRYTLSVTLRTSGFTDNVIFAQAEAVRLTRSLGLGAQEYPL